MSGQDFCLELDTAIAFKGEMQRAFAWIMAMRSSCGDSGEDPERILVSWGRRPCAHVFSCACNWMAWHWLGQKSKQLLYRHPCNLRRDAAPRDVYRGYFTAKADNCMIWETWLLSPFSWESWDPGGGFLDPNFLSGLAPELKSLLDEESQEEASKACL